MNLYLAEKGLDNNIIYSQLCVPLNYLYGENIDVLLLTHEKMKQYSDRLKFPLRLYSKNYQKYIYIIMNKSTIQNIYSRSIFEFYILFFIKMITFSAFKIRYDYRGLISEESFLRNKSEIRRRVLKLLEDRIYFLADSISTVSNNFKKYIIENSGVEKDVVVTPCCTTTANLKAYEKSGIVKFIYVGGLSVWQNFDKIILLYKNISKKLANTTLTIITKDVARAREICNHKGVEAEIFSIDNSQINSVLQDYDFGFLLRDNILLNKVASPVKFLEYTSSGVIPIISNGIGDYSDLVKENSIGISIDENITIECIVEQIRSLKNDDGIYERLYKFSIQYTWEKFYKNFKL